MDKICKAYSEFVETIKPDIDGDSLINLNAHPNDIDFDLVCSIVVANALSEDSRLKIKGIKSFNIYETLQNKVKHVDNQTMINVLYKYEKMEDLPLVCPNALECGGSYDYILNRLSSIHNTDSYKTLINFILHGEDSFIAKYNTALSSLLGVTKTLGDDNKEDLVGTCLITKVLYACGYSIGNEEMGVHEILNIILENTKVASLDYIRFLLPSITNANCIDNCLIALNLANIDIKGTTEVEDLLRLVEEIYSKSNGENKTSKLTF